MRMRNQGRGFSLSSSLLLLYVILVYGETNPNDFEVLDEFRKGLDNPELLRWPPGSKDPCGDKWPYIFCSGSRVSQIQAKNLGLVGPLPLQFNKLTELSNVGLQRNRFSGQIPSFSGLSKLQYAYLDNNEFDSIPVDFFVNLTSLQVLSLSSNPLNRSNGWVLPKDIVESAQLSNLSLTNCSLVGRLPDFLGPMPSLTKLEMAYNNLSGEVPASFNGSSIQILWLNNQYGVGLSGSLDVIMSMQSLSDAWLHGNSFSGPIPDSIGQLGSLWRMLLNNNKLVGLLPDSLTKLPQLQVLKLDNNKLMGQIPKTRIRNFTYSFNSFCQDAPGVPCEREVIPLLEFLDKMNYPLDLASSWAGNDPCVGIWRGVSCTGNKVSVINLPNMQLNGTISPSLGQLDGLVNVKLAKNNLLGTIPSNLTSLPSLKTLDVSFNNIGPPVPKFRNDVVLLTTGNPLLDASTPKRSPPISPSTAPDASPSKTNSSEDRGLIIKHGFRKSRLWIIVATIVGIMSIISLVLLAFFCWKRKKGTHSASSSIVVHPRDLSDPSNEVKIVVRTSSALDTPQSSKHNSLTETHVIESGNLVVSVQILRKVTKNFAPENELGRGGFGVVYKGVLDDGAMIAVKRMEASVVNNKALNEFQSEIAVLSNVRHRNLVSLWGYSIEGNERLLVYEYMPHGALSNHLFQWKALDMEPLSWKKRLNIALDVARGMEYLHSLAKHCFIHRDLKSSNILLGDDFRAKVSDFGLVKNAAHGNNSVTTRLAGTFGYLAPEYAVTGKVTTKADVFSYGVVLMELLTGLRALDEDRPEEKSYLASWFCNIKTCKEKLRSAIDASIDITDETFNNICTIAELAGHCAAREPYQRPDMGHAVNVLAPLVEQWKPVSDDQEDYLGIDLGQPLLQMVKGWQAADGIDISSSTALGDSKGSIPAKPAGFAESFTSADGR